MKGGKYNILKLGILISALELGFWLAFAVVLLFTSTDNLIFQSPASLWLAIPALIIPASYLYFAIKSNSSRLKLGNEKIQKSLLSELSTKRLGLNYGLLKVGINLLIIALANPQFGTKEVTGSIRGSEIIIALDISNSMLAKDAGNKTRVARAKRAIDRLSATLINDKIGIVVFAGEAYTQLPLTTDYAALRLFLSSISPHSITAQGTSLHKAIEQSLGGFDHERKSSRAIILISDGEDHEQEAIDIAAQAKDLGVQIHTVGIGTTAGTKIEIGQNENGPIYFTDNEGNDVITVLNEKILTDIATAANGQYFKATENDLGLIQLVEELNAMNKEIFKTDKFEEIDDYFQPFLAAGFILIVLSFVLPISDNRKESVS